MSDFSSLLSRMVKTHTKATMRPTRSKKMKPNAAVLGLLILRRRSFLLALPPSDPGAGAACDGEHVLLSFIVICKAYSYESSTTMLILAKGQLQQLPPIRRQGAQASKEQSFNRMRCASSSWWRPPHRLTRLAFGEIQQIQASTPSLLQVKAKLTSHLFSRGSPRHNLLPPRWHRPPANAPSLVPFCFFPPMSGLLSPGSLLRASHQPLWRVRQHVASRAEFSSLLPMMRITAMVNWTTGSE